MRSTRASIGVAHYFKFNSSDPHCGVRAKDVAVPPYVPQVHSAAFLAAGRAATATRPLRFFFAGNVPEAHQASGPPGGYGRSESSIWQRAGAGQHCEPRHHTQDDRVDS